LIFLLFNPKTFRTVKTSVIYSYFVGKFLKWKKLAKNWQIVQNSQPLSQISCAKLLLHNTSEGPAFPRLCNPENLMSTELRGRLSVKEAVQVQVREEEEEEKEEEDEEPLPTRVRGRGPFFVTHLVSLFRR
jgi:hypothetical protein